MESMGIEVSQKIRSAIKAKLVELGAYVDEELPDYIMVMVANKKTRLQMTEDLSLFLGTNTEKFTAWLHEVLEKLQSVALESKRKSEPKQKEKPDKSSKAMAPVLPLAKPQASKATTKAYQSKKHEDPAKTPDAEDNQEEVLAIRADFEADDLLAEELRDELVLAPKTNAGSTAKRQNIVTPMQRSILVSQKANAVPTLQPSMISIPSVALPSQKTKDRKPSASIHSWTTRSRHFGSTIHAKSRNEHKDEDHSKTRGRTIPSVVKVSERRPSLPPTLQANKSLILRAMEEAKKSVIAAAQKIPVKIQPYKRPLAQEQKPERHGKRPKIFSEEIALHKPEAVEAQPTLNDEIELMDVDEEVLVDENSIPQDMALASPPMISQEAYVAAISMEEPISTMHDRFVKTSFAESSTNTPSPKFIVTLDGIDGDSFQRTKGSVLRGVRSSDLEETKALVTPVTINLEERDGEFFSSQDDVRPLTILQRVGPLKKQNTKERCKYWPACKNGPSCSFHHPIIQCKTFPRCKYMDKCLYIHPNCKFDATCTRKDCPFTHASKRTLATPSDLPGVRRRFVEAKPAKSSGLNPKQIKCRFFPQCTNMNCKYLHPKACRYGFSCTLSGCVFGHPPLPSKEKLKWMSQVPVGPT